MAPMPGVQWVAAAPELILVVTISLILLLDCWLPACPYLAGAVSLIGLAAALAAATFSLPSLMPALPWGDIGAAMPASLSALITSDSTSTFFPSCFWQSGSW